MSGLVGGSSAKTLRVREFRTSGTFNVPAGVKTVGLFLVGGGGAGSTSSGQGGNVVETMYDVSSVGSCLVMVGAGGVGYTNGSDTVFDGVVVAVGGRGNSIPGTTFDGYPGGAKGFGGHGVNGAVAPGNGARQGMDGAPNSGAGASPSGDKNGAAGYCRVEWYE